MCFIPSRTESQSGELAQSHNMVDTHSHTWLLFSEQKTGHSEMCTAHASEHNGTFHLFLVTFIFFCCWIPSIIVSISEASTMASGGRTLPPQTHTMSAWLARLNSAINPLLYALLREKKRCRKALKNLNEKTLFNFIS